MAAAERSSTILLVHGIRFNSYAGMTDPIRRYLSRGYHEVPFEMNECLEQSPGAFDLAEREEQKVAKRLRITLIVRATGLCYECLKYPSPFPSKKTYSTNAQRS